ncbi:hypothetical protein [Daejeonia sp. YH14]|uniref:hypothetical protein n=1 Tax=Daejeonia sp. YH14 TaxID=3439042 RepID=UPI003F4996F2
MTKNEKVLIAELIAEVREIKSILKNELQHSETMLKMYDSLAQLFDGNNILYESYRESKQRATETADRANEFIKKYISVN